NEKRTYRSKSALEYAIHSVTGIFLPEEPSAYREDKPTVREEVEHYAGELLKTIPLMLANKTVYGSAALYAASGFLYGLSEVRVGDSPDEQRKDLVLGFVKGASTKLAFELIGNREMSIPRQGLATSFVSLLLDVGLSRNTYLDRSGQFDFLLGL